MLDSTNSTSCFDVKSGEEGRIHGHDPQTGILNGEISKCTRISLNYNASLHKKWAMQMNQLYVLWQSKTNFPWNATRNTVNECSEDQRH